MSPENDFLSWHYPPFYLFCTQLKLLALAKNNWRQITGMHFASYTVFLLETLSLSVAVSDDQKIESALV